MRTRGKGKDINERKKRENKKTYLHVKRTDSSIYQDCDEVLNVGVEDGGRQVRVQSIKLKYSLTGYCINYNVW